MIGSMMIQYPLTMLQEGTGDMEYELKSARYLAEDVLRRVIRPGDSVIDATMGNGRDTLTLCEAVGPGGRVYAFDIQPQAVSAARDRLREHQMLGRASLFCVGHQEMDAYVPVPVRAVVFNLGWLPGGDHSITTRWETTRRAVMKALAMLQPLGVLVVCAYPGHPEGDHERAGLTALLAGLSSRQYNVLHQCFLNASPGAPECFVVQKLS